MKNLRQSPRNFDEIFTKPHQRCLLPTAKVEEIRTAVQRMLLDLQFAEAGDLSTPETSEIWMRAYSREQPVTRENADVILDKGGYRFQDRPVFRITVRHWRNNAVLGGQIFTLLLQHDIAAPTVVDVFEQDEMVEGEPHISFVFVLIPNQD